MINAKTAIKLKMVAAIYWTLAVCQTNVSFSAQAVVGTKEEGQFSCGCCGARKRWPQPRWDRPSSSPHFGQEHHRASPSSHWVAPLSTTRQAPGSKPHHRGAKQEVTLSVLIQWAPGGEAKSAASPGASPESSRRQRCLLGRSPPGDRCALLRTLLQQLQKLQTLVTNKISRPYKMAATQTGTCLMVGAAPSFRASGGHVFPRLAF